MNMTAALNVYDAFVLWNRREPGKELEFQKAHPNEYKLVMGLLKEL